MEDNHIHMDDATWLWIEIVATAQKRLSTNSFALWPRDLWKGSFFTQTSDTTSEVRFTAEDALDYAETVESAWKFKQLENALMKSEIQRFLALCRLGSITVHITEEIEDDSRDWVC